MGDMVVVASGFFVYSVCRGGCAAVMYIRDKIRVASLVDGREG